MLSNDCLRSIKSTRPLVLLFPASLRRDSHQRRLVDYLAALAGDRCDIDVLEPGEVDLPLFNQDLENSEAALGAVRMLHERFTLARAVIVASPEYNGNVSPYLKNTLDWISRLSRIDPSYAAINPFRDKPLLLSSASTGWTGGILGLQSARSIFAYLGYLVVSDQICVGNADHWTNGGSYHFEPAFASHIDRILGDFLSLVSRLQEAKPHLMSVEEQAPELERLRYA